MVSSSLSSYMENFSKKDKQGMETEETLKFILSYTCDSFHGQFWLLKKQNLVQIFGEKTLLKNPEN